MAKLPAGLRDQDEPRQDDFPDVYAYRDAKRAYHEARAQYFGNRSVRFAGIAIITAAAAVLCGIASMILRLLAHG